MRLHYLIKLLLYGCIENLECKSSDELKLRFIRNSEIAIGQNSTALKQRDLLEELGLQRIPMKIFVLIFRFNYSRKVHHTSFIFVYQVNVKKTS